MTLRKGSLAVVGTGIESLGHLTPAARNELRRAQKVFYLAADPVTEETLLALNPRSESLRPLYKVGRNRLVTYAAMAQRVMTEVRRGRRVCFALYGHPGVFARPAHSAVSIARSEGYRATMLPGVSADACLIADLGIDPATFGLQSYEATDFVVHRRKADNRSGLLLWQVGCMGRVDYPSGPIDRTKIALLTEMLLEIYPRKHQAQLYEAPTLPGFEPSIETVRIGSLHEGPITTVTTMYVPPSRRAKVDRAMLARLGIHPADRLRCLRLASSP